MPRRIIIDTDPGQDDAVAILLALGSPQDITVDAIVTVAGNVPLLHTSQNALKIIELAGRGDVPVYAGCARPMRRAPFTAEYVHGPTGLDGPVLPAPRVALRPEHGVDYIISALRAAAPGEITLCALGPVTNIAMALVKAPDIAAKIARIVMMGGAYFEVGNVTPAAEFNIYVDPEAMDVVLKSGVPLVIMPLDVTHKALITPQRMERIRKVGTKSAIAVYEMLSFSERFDLGKYQWGGAPLHDPTVIAYLLKPELFTGRTINVVVDTTGEFTVGMTIADWWGVTNRPANALFMGGVDADGFVDLIAERLARLP